MLPLDSKSPITMGEIRKFIERRIWIVIGVLMLTIFMMLGSQALHRKELHRQDAAITALANELGNFKRDQAHVNGLLQDQICELEIIADE